MNPDCENANRNGDCLTRNSRLLCDSCESLLSPDELAQREIAFMVAKYRRAAAGAKPGCTKPRKYDGGRTCIKKNLQALCPGCIAGMSDAKLWRYVRKLYKEMEETRQYWREYQEAIEYAAELKAAGIAGIDWNIEQTSADEYKERSYLIYSLFLFGKPCFIHPEEMEQAA